jgi:hypothetical protein
MAFNITEKNEISWHPGGKMKINQKTSMRKRYDFFKNKQSGIVNK